MNLGFETETIEFKKTTGELKEGIISLASMLNKHGHGTLYFGVNDNGTIRGQEIGKETLRDISRGISEAIKPQIIPTISAEFVDDKNIIKVAVNGAEKPYSAYGKYYIRTADEDREMFPEQLKQMMSTMIEDLIVNIPATNQDLTFNQLKTLFATKGLTLANDTFLSNLGFYTTNKKLNLMAELLSDNNDFSIKVVKFKGKDKTEIINRNELGFKCLLLAVDQVLTLIESYNETKVSLNSHQRYEEKLFDMLCFKEAWQNACIHNKWSKLNPPAVYIFDDRIEIISTGSIEGNITKEEFYRGISKPVNQKLQKIFGQLGYVEQTGHGVPLIVKKYGEQAFEIMDNFINVTIPFNKNMIKENLYNSLTTNNLNDSQLKIYNYLKENPQATINELVNNCSLSDGYVRKILMELKRQNIIERVGSNKTGYWKIK